MCHLNIRLFSVFSTEIDQFKCVSVLNLIASTALVAVSLTNIAYL
ncbi:hypothetical protein QWZ13_07820 [Reinekea marina]|nr:hypothetical protein [Reinekea marina]MDN3648815.1 hypothetical protein [Reinekea marina]